MKLSSQEEYGLRCLLQIGRQGDGGSRTISELAQSEGISPPHVAKIMRILRRAALVTSTRGQSGGYSLSRPAGSIVVGEALAALGGRIYEPSFCDRHTGFEELCTHSVDCSIRSVWRMVQGAVDQVLGKLTLQDLLRTEQEMTGWSDPNRPTLPTFSA
jgi:Rrf2 family protein